MKIYKGVQPQYFRAIADGRKRFELRLADFKYKPGDILVLQEQKKGSKELTGRTIECELLFTLNTKMAERFYSRTDIAKYGLAVMSLRRHYCLR